MRSLLAAVAFLTRFPIGRLSSWDAPAVSRSAAWFPLVGLLLGGLYAGAARLLLGHLPLMAIAVLLVILDAGATGALHLDGLADSADGFGGGETPDDVLRIMRDHAIGAYGGIALATLVALKTAAYAALLGRNDWFAPLVLTPALGRWSMLLLTAALPYARPSASVIVGMNKWSLVWGTVTILPAIAAALSARAWIAMAAVTIVSAAFGAYCRRRIGGITGDTLGANLQLCESASLLTFLWEVGTRAT